MLSLLALVSSETVAQQLEDLRPVLDPKGYRLKVELVAITSLSTRLGEEKANSSWPILLACEPEQLDQILNTGLKQSSSPLILLSEPDSTHTLRMAKQAGAVDYVCFASMAEDIPLILSELSLSLGTVGSVIAFTGMGGGAGSSTMASAFAQHCQNKLKNKTALVDFDPLYGRLGVDFAIGSRAGFAADFSREIQGAHMAEALSKPTLSGIDLYSAPHAIEFDDYEEFDAADEFSAALQQHYETIVLDIPTRLANFDTDLFQRVDHLMIVSHVDLAGIRNTANFMKWLESNFETDAHVIFNQASRKSPFEPKELRALLKLNHHFWIETDAKLCKHQLRSDLNTPQVPQCQSSTAKVIAQIAQRAGLRASKKTTQSPGLLPKFLNRHA
ncbi:MAG: hypothetical protein HWE20_05455 [Gammaproteobacteria bacterium]|nr:hypothetical protein [Gammaproteobacteria bacterium]